MMDSRFNALAIGLSAAVKGSSMRWIAGVAIALLLLVASCDFSMGGYKPYPEPPSGKASVSGVIQAVAPVATMNYTSADQTAPDATGQLYNFLQLGLFLEGYNPPAYTIDFNNHPFHATGDRTWETAFNADQLAAGDFTISQFQQPYADYGVAPSWSQFNKLQSFTLTKSETATLDAVVLDMGGEANGNSFSGRILIEGNPIGPLDMQILLQYETQLQGFYPFYSGELVPIWQFALQSPMPDRLYFDIAEIGPDSCFPTVNAHNSTGSAIQTYRFIDGQPASNDVLDLTSSHTIDIYVRLQAQYYLLNNDINANEGQIDCTINLTDAVIWDSDILLVAEDISGAPASANSRCSRYLFPVQTTHGTQTYANLSWLRAGTYSIDVYLLGEDNSVQRERIGGLNEPFELELPPLQKVEYTEVFYVQPRPYAELEFDLAVPDGI